ncbi:MAG TPA: hypothetical protein VEU74_10470 [Gemmatimonadales bacterium]|nr:hypothetical protein [Gemmatimonadales bacterium]
MRVSRWTAPVLLLACAMAARGSAQEKRLKRSDLPPAVLKTADEQSAGASVRGYSSETEDGRLEYEVALTVHGHGRDVTIAPDGTLLEIEEEVAVDSLPAAVRTGLLQAAGAGKIVKVESLTKRGAIVAYEAQVRTGTKRSEVQVGPDGKPLAHPE